MPSLPHGEVDPHAVEVQLVAVEVVSGGSLRDVVETMLPNFRVGVVERHPETLLGQFGRELAVRHRRHQELRVLRLVDVVQFLQGAGPERRVKIAYAQGSPDLQPLFMAGPKVVETGRMLICARCWPVLRLASIAASWDVLMP